jgi:hypothetical protein
MTDHLIVRDKYDAGGPTLRAFKTTAPMSVGAADGDAPPLTIEAGQYVVLGNERHPEAPGSEVIRFVLDPDEFADRFEIDDDTESETTIVVVLESIQRHLRQSTDYRYVTISDAGYVRFKGYSGVDRGRTYEITVRRID